MHFSIRQFFITMLRFTVLTIVLAVALADSDDPKKKCMRLEHPGAMLCCKSAIPVPKLDAAEFKECMDLPHDRHSCEKEICFAKKRGFVSSDSGDIDMEALKMIVAEDYKDVPDLITAITKNCIEGNIDKYGPPNPKFCQLKKMKRCMHYQALNECKEWDNASPCDGIEDLVEECDALKKE